MNTPSVHPDTRIGHVHLKVADLHRALATALDRVLEAGIEIDGAADHGGSEAIYLRDPDQNGVELYRDRPESEWPRDSDGTLRMFTRPLDLDALLKEVRT